jgi:hypothetical protein
MLRKIGKRKNLRVSERIKKSRMTMRHLLPEYVYHSMSDMKVKPPYPKSFTPCKYFDGHKRKFRRIELHCEAYNRRITPDMTTDDDDLCEQILATHNRRKVGYVNNANIYIT